MTKLRIRTQFLTLFMIVGLIPLFVIVSLFFIQSSRILEKNSLDHIASIQDIKTRQLENDIEHRFSEFSTLITNEIIDNLYHDLLDGKKELDVKYSNYFSSFLLTNNFYNVFILSDYDGDVLYSFKDEKGYRGDTGLRRVWEKAMSSEEVVLQDFSEFFPSMGMQSAFIGKRFYNDDGSRAGVMVLQITDSFIDSVLNSRHGMGESGESYLIAYNPALKSYEFRSNVETLGKGLYKIGYSWRGEIPEYWNDAVAHDTIGGGGVYYDSTGNAVLTAYSRINIPKLNWYLITIISKDEVLFSLNHVLIFVLIIVVSLLALIAVLSVYFSSKLTAPILKSSDFARSISEGKYQKNLDIDRTDEIGVLARSLKDMGRNLKEQEWIRLGKEGLDYALRGEHDLREMGSRFISFLVKYLGAQLGALYLLKDDKYLHLTSSYAFSDRKGTFNKIAIGEGLVGQAALEKDGIVYTHAPTDAQEYNYGVASMLPTSYIATPLLFEGELIGVALIGITVPVTKLQRKFISSIKESIAILLNSAKTSSVIQGLLDDAQVKQEELRVSNEELEQQTEALKDSEQELQAQQEELRVTNEELKERTKDLESKADDLERASQYKSEFLANMSHELRTPLNSILILSQLISSNKKGNLDEKQIKSAQAINSSGEDLLKLINEILDLSKVEAGKIEIHPEIMTIDSFIEDMDRVFRPTADQKEINLNYIKGDNLPQSIITDPHRLQQILKNLLTNAFKFTDKLGTVTLKMYREENNVHFAVSDTGIGIPKGKQAAVFEAFQQADGSTSRKYGGTGLGLSISRELIKLLGGTISIESEEGVGSTFSVSLPIREGSALPANKEVVEIHVKDDRKVAVRDEKTLLIIEDDIKFAAILKEQAHDRGFKVLIAEDGETGLHFADYYRPSSIILDIGLPGIDGLAVMDRLKNDPELRHVPVLFISGKEEELPALQMGAVGYIKKPVSTDSISNAFDKIETSISSRLRNLLIVEDDTLQRESIEALIGGDDIAVFGVATGQEAHELMKKKHFDCVILDLGLEDMSGYELLDKVKNDSNISDTPIIIYTGRDLSSDEELKLNKYSESIIIKGIKSPERLLEQTSLFLRRENVQISEDKKDVSLKTAKREEVFSGKTVLIVDDDMRNIFALTNILEEKDINVIVARDGIESIEQVRTHSEIDLVLMDIMMPRMDGYEAMGEIRKVKDKDSLPIIALTANAMKGDRSKCIDAGANDYLAKPVDNSKLVSMLRVWMY